MFSKISSVNEEPYCHITNWDLLRRTLTTPCFSGYQEDDVHYPMIQKKQMTKKCGKKEIKQKRPKMEKKTWNDSSLTRPRKPSSAAENDGLEDGLQSPGGFFLPGKTSDDKKWGNFGWWSFVQEIEVRHPIISSLKISNHSNWSHVLAFLATIHSTFCLKRPKIKYQKRLQEFQPIQLTEMGLLSETKSAFFRNKKNRNHWERIWINPKKSNHSNSFRLFPMFA